MSLRNTPHHMNWLSLLIPLKYENARTFWEFGIVFQEYGFRHSCYGLTRKNTILR